MVRIELSTSTLAVLIAGLYCTSHEVNSLAIPESIWLMVAERVEYFLPDWNYEFTSFEDWVNYSLFIYPKELLNESDIEHIKNNTLYSEIPNGNTVLIVSMDMNMIE